MGGKRQRQKAFRERERERKKGHLATSRESQALEVRLRRWQMMTHASLVLYFAKYPGKCQSESLRPRGA
eukprot:10454779-Karenia_brevis.AAC.1